jgi:hypothetical protein
MLVRSICLLTPHILKTQTLNSLDEMELFRNLVTLQLLTLPEQVQE